MHMRFACLLYAELQVKLPREEICAMLDEAVILEKAFFSGESKRLYAACLLIFVYSSCTPHSVRWAERQYDGGVHRVCCRRLAGVSRSSSSI